MKRFLTSLFARSAKSRTVRPALTEKHRAFLRLETLEDRQLLSAATFVNADLTTQGNWKGMYGKDGYNVIGDTVNYPSYASVTPKNGDGQDVLGNYFASTQSDPRALQKVNASDRQLSYWYNYDYVNHFTIDVNLTDGQAHQVSLYACDFDKQNRSERIDILDSANQATLDSRTVSSFTGGEYLIWNLSGHVQINVTQLSGPNAVVNGLFFDPVSQSTSAAPAAPTGLTWAYGSGNTGTLYWSSVAGADGYRIQYSSDNSNWSYLVDNHGVIVGIPANTTSQQITDGGGFYFRVSAYNAAGETFSASVLVDNNTNPVTAPPAPTGLTWASTSGNDITLSWQAAAGATGYDVEYYNGQQWVSLGKVDANVTTVTIPNGYGYYFAIGAFNDAGETFSDPIYAGN